MATITREISLKADPDFEKIVSFFKKRNYSLSEQKPNSLLFAAGSSLGILIGQIFPMPFSMMRHSVHIEKQDAKLNITFSKFGHFYISIHYTDS